MGYLTCRKRAGLTQTDVAKALGVTVSAVCQWENGLTTPTGKRLPEIAKLYGCTIDELLAPDENNQ